jgi:hypothetical protein
MQSNRNNGTIQTISRRTSIIAFVLILVLAATCAFARDKDKDKDKDKKADAAHVVDSGSFGIFLNGKRVGTEKFNIEQATDLGIITADLKVDDGSNKAEQHSEMRVAPDGKLKIYKWQSTVPDHEESIVEAKDDFLVEHVTAADQKKLDVPYILPLTTVILDDNFFSQRELLLWRYLIQGGCKVENGERLCGPAHFGALVPQQHISINTVVELLGRDKISVNGVEKELNKFKIDTDGVPWFVWMDDMENNYKVLKMSIPSSNIEVVRD